MEPQLHMRRLIEQRRNAVKHAMPRTLAETIHAAQNADKLRMHLQGFWKKMWSVSLPQTLGGGQAIFQL